MGVLEVSVVSVDVIDVAVEVKTVDVVEFAVEVVIVDVVDVSVVTVDVLDVTTIETVFIGSFQKEIRNNVLGILDSSTVGAHIDVIS